MLLHLINLVKINFKTLNFFVFSSKLMHKNFCTHLVLILKYYDSIFQKLFSIFSKYFKINFHMSNLDFIMLAAFNDFMSRMNDMNFKIINVNINFVWIQHLLFYYTLVNIIYIKQKKENNRSPMLFALW